MRADTPEYRSSRLSTEFRGLLLLFAGGLLGLGGILSPGCSELGPDNSLGESQDTTLDPTVPLTVVPGSGRIGTPIAITWTRLNPSGRYAVAFRGADEPLLITPDSAHTLHAFVPFGAVTGAIVVAMPGCSGTTQTFVVSETSDTTGLTVAQYDILPPVTPADSAVIDRMGFRRSWQTSVHGDTIHLSRAYSTGDEYYEYHFFLIGSRAQVLPQAAGAWVFIQPDYPGSETDTIRAGIFKIQEWRPDGVMSGRFFGSPSIKRMLNGTTAFWARGGG